MTTAFELRDQLRERFTARAAVRLGRGLPLVLAVGYGLVVGEVQDLELFVSVVLAGVVLAVMSSTRPWRTEPPDAAAAERADQLWQLASGVVGVGLLVPFLLAALDVEVQRFAPFVALLLITGVYGLPRRLQLPLSAWTIAVWAVVLVGAGIDEPAILVLHLGGGVMVVAATMRVADVLATSLADAATARRDAERRATLLASLLRTHSLDPDDVLRAVTTGLMGAGFDVAVIRAIDAESGGAVLVDGVARSELELREVVPAGAGLLGVCVREGRRVLVDDLDADPRATDRGAGLRGTVLIPLFDGDAVVAVVSASSTSGPLVAAQVEAAALLAEQAGHALVRARAFASDRRTVEDLRGLDTRTQDFVSTVSHELRTPLTVIDGLGQTLLTRWDDLDPGRREDLLRRIDANADRLAVMVRSLLDTSALEHGELELQPQALALREVVADLLHRLATVTAAHPVSLDIDPRLHAQADRGLFEHIIENLLMNVAKHTPQGTRVTISAHRDGDVVEVAVADDGPGIGPDDLPHVLDRFYRGGDPGRRKSGGLGLGLALARQIVEAHGSELRVESREGQGTRFSFLVPAAP